MYNCQACKKSTIPKQTMLRLVEYRKVPWAPESERTVKQIKREIPVCPSCYELNKDKESFDF